MRSILTATISQKSFKILTFGLIIIISGVPLLMKYPFNINIFLAWEGAYRIYLGQVPGIDFYLPMGFVFWLLPALFFKIFGPYLFTLIIFQSFINLVTFLTFGYILRLLKVNYFIIFLSTLVLGLSYVLLNFWPWYNNFVFVLQLVSILFLLLYRAANSIWQRYTLLFMAAGFTVLAFFTKQDAGGLTVVLNFVLILFISFRSKQYKEFIYFSLFILAWTLPFIVPFLSHDFLYWFNLGQTPHYSRLNLFTYLDQLFSSSHWIKLYLLVITLLLLTRYKSLKELFSNESDFIFMMITLGIIFQASIIQVTSYIPHYSYYYLHGFAFAYILSFVAIDKKLSTIGPFVFVTFLVSVLWSADSWKYGQKYVRKILPESFFKVPDNVVAKSTWLVSDKTVFDNRANWKLSEYKSLKRVYLPPETIDGIHRLAARHENLKGLKVLNMTELSMLSYEFGYIPIKNQPLWFHKNVSIFDREIAKICDNIRSHHYDLVLFESIPILNDFYPEEISSCLKENYTIVDKFRAPRREKNSVIIVYEK